MISLTIYARFRYYSYFWSYILRLVRDHFQLDVWAVHFRERLRLHGDFCWIAWILGNLLFFGLQWPGARLENFTALSTVAFGKLIAFIRYLSLLNSCHMLLEHRLVHVITEFIIFLRRSCKRYFLSIRRNLHVILWETFIVQTICGLPRLWFLEMRMIRIDHTLRVVNWNLTISALIIQRLFNCVMIWSWICIYRILHGLGRYFCDILVVITLLISLNFFIYRLLVIYLEILMRDFWLI